VKAFPDASFLCALYRQQVNSERARFAAGKGVAVGALEVDRSPAVLVEERVLRGIGE
jgi:hypothetical protein